jgi:hypothetical protein
VLWIILELEECPLEKVGKLWRGKSKSTDNSEIESSNDMVKQHWYDRSYIRR